MAPEGVRGPHFGRHRGGHIVASLYIPSRARVGRIGSDSMIHISQNVTFGMSHFGLLTRFCRNVSEGEIRGVQIRPDLGPIWDPKMDPIWDPKMDPILGPILDPQIGPMAPQGVSGQGSKYGPFQGSKMDPFWALFWTSKMGS